MGRLLAIAAAIILAVVFLPGLINGGSGGAKDAGSKAGSSALDAAKDPQAVIDGASTVVTPIADVATPWWQWLIAQPWFYAFLACGIAAFLARRWWANLGQGARQITVGAAVALIFFLFIAFSGKG